MFVAVANDPRAEEDIERRMKQIEMGEVDNRPDLLGLSREARQTLELQTEVALLHRVHHPGWPLPVTPETAGERIQKRREQAQVDDLFGTIFKANPSLFGVTAGKR